MRCDAGVNLGLVAGQTQAGGEAYRRKKIEDFGVMFVRRMLQRRHDGSVPCKPKKQAPRGPGELVSTWGGEVPPGFDGW